MGIHGIYNQAALNFYVVSRVRTPQANISTARHNAALVKNSIKFFFLFHMLRNVA